MVASAGIHASREQPALRIAVGDRYTAADFRAGKSPSSTVAAPMAGIVLHP